MSTSRDARRFQLGAPSFGGIAALGEAIDELSAIGAATVERHSQMLAARAIDILRGFGLMVVTPTDASSRAGNIAFLHKDCESLAEALAARNVLVWAGDGRVRLSLHVMNGVDDIESLATALADVLA